MAVERQMIVWGGMAVGKTSLLAAGLVSPAANRRLGGLLDWSRSRDAFARLRTEWDRLGQNLNVVNTNDLQYGLPLSLASGDTLVLRDVRGGGTERVYQPSAGDLIDSILAADAVMFAIEWRPRALRDQLDSLHQAVQHLGDRLREKVSAVVFTKCEGAIPDDDPRWSISRREAADWNTRFPPADRWWHDGWPELLADDRALLDRLGPAWATSVFGFRPRDHRPACLLDEFGELIPFGIQPVNVVEVFEWFLQRLTPTSP